MSETVIAVPEEWKRRAHIDAAKFEEMYADSIADPEGFWEKAAADIDWHKPWDKVDRKSVV